MMMLLSLVCKLSFSSFRYYWSYCCCQCWSIRSRSGCLCICHSPNTAQASGTEGCIPWVMCNWSVCGLKDIVKNQQLEISKANAALSEEHEKLMKKSPDPSLPKAEPAPAAPTNNHTVKAQVVTEHAHVSSIWMGFCSRVLVQVTTIEREPALAPPAGRGCVACKECVIL